MSPPSTAPAPPACSSTPPSARPTCGTTRPSSTIGAPVLSNPAGLSHRVPVAEGNALFLVTRPASRVRRSLRDDEVRRRTGCHIVAVLEEDGTLGYDTESIPAAPGKLLLLGD